MQASRSGLQIASPERDACMHLCAMRVRAAWLSLALAAGSCFRPRETR